MLKAPTHLERRAGAKAPAIGLLDRIRRLFGWSTSAEADADGSSGDPNALGPAFRSGSPAELAMVYNILRLRDLRVEDVMTPRADIEAVAEDRLAGGCRRDAFETGGYSRMPVYRETLDDPVGFVHLKDLALEIRLWPER